MTDLEKYIVENREKFDLHIPSPEVWDRLEHDLETIGQTRQKIQPGRWLSIAAALAICAGAFFFTWQSIPQADPSALVSDVNPSYAQQIKYTQEDIDNRKKQINTLLREHPELVKKFAADLMALDLTYEKLKENLLVNQNQEVLIKAMIANLKLQVNILENQLELLQNLKNNIHENDTNSI